MNLTCKYCAAEIKPENINRETRIARCPQCGAVFGVATQSRPPHSAPEPPPAGAAAAPARPAVAMPQGYTVTEENGELVISRLWRDGATVWLAGFAVFWNAMVGLAILATLMMQQVVLLPLVCLHILTGLGFAYGASIKLFNRTQVRVGPGELRVTHGPLPWLAGSKRWVASDIQQLYARERVRYGRRARRYVSYEVCGLLGPNRKNEVLVAYLPDAQQALFLEQQIERALRLRDVPVVGELPR